MTKTDDAVKAEEKVEATAVAKKNKSSKVKKSTKAAKPAKEKATKATKAEKPKKAASTKAAKPKKEKVAKPKKAPVETDKFGFRKTSKKSEAATMYSTKKGATLAEVKEATGSSQLNLLTELEKKGFKINKTKEPGAGKKQVTRYKIVTK